MTPVLFVLLIALADEPPPLVGRPPDFCGAVGPRVRGTITATPTTLTLGESLTLTLRMSGANNPGDITRPKLDKQSDFTADFQVENGPDRLLADGREFDYRLRPLRAEVKAVPLVKVVYYRPGSGYQTTYAGDLAHDGDIIPLMVRPRAALPEMSGPLEAPAFLFDVPLGERLLHPTASAMTWRNRLLGALLLGQLLALTGAVVWRWRHPGPAREAVRRRSKAARKALRELSRLRGPITAPVAVVLADTLRQYLADWFDLPAVAVTPTEIEQHLQAQELPPALTARVTSLLRACDAVRFAPPEEGPAPPGLEELRAEATALVADLEAPCAPS